MSISKDKLSDSAATEAARALPGWSVVEGKLHREYKFPDFTHAFGFLAASATVVEKMDHHPEWFNVYSTVRVDLTTHDSGGITALDVELAKKLEQIAQKLL
ncbi:MAG: 4a-hydroxytetrahydrobiopterin dehydratase [Bryobacteraceae bacterium]|nr:4a-hydroxytetrahydrobiopterin dehydratase [Bryobacteraceae bacterium]